MKNILIGWVLHDIIRDKLLGIVYTFHNKILYAQPFHSLQ